MAKKYLPPPKSLANLRPAWRPGQSGNPSGNRKSVYFERTLRKVFLAKSAMDKGRKVHRLDHMLRRLYETSIAFLDDAQTDFAKIIPLLELLEECLDGKDPHGRREEIARTEPA
jgi:Family of unknown function (DUF5681)